MSMYVNNAAFPLVENKAAVIDALHKSVTKAAFLRDPAWKEHTVQITNGLEFEDDPMLGAKYVFPDRNGHRNYAGEREYERPFTIADIQNETAQAGIRVTPEGANALLARVNTLRALFADIYETYSGKKNRPIIGRILFTPKHGVGRSPVMHVDNTELTLHSGFNLATLRVLGMNPSDRIWEMLDRKMNQSLTSAQKEGQEAQLNVITQEYNSEFFSAVIGDAVIMKGQENRDLSDPAVRESVCVHASSPFIPHQGQAGVVFYPKKSLDNPEAAL